MEMGSRRGFGGRSFSASLASSGGVRRKVRIVAMSSSGREREASRGKVLRFSN